MIGSKSQTAKGPLLLPVERAILESLTGNGPQNCFTFPGFQGMRHTVKLLNPNEPYSGLDYPNSYQELQDQSDQIKAAY